MATGNYSYVIGMNTPIGWAYKIQGDSVSALTKKDCEYRIRKLYNAGVFDKSCRDYLLASLKALKRGT